MCRAPEVRGRRWRRRGGERDRQTVRETRLAKRTFQKNRNSKKKTKKKEVEVIFRFGGNRIRTSRNPKSGPLGFSTGAGAVGMPPRARASSSSSATCAFGLARAASPDASPSAFLVVPTMVVVVVVVSFFSPEVFALFVCSSADMLTVMLCVSLCLCVAGVAGVGARAREAKVRAVCCGRSVGGPSACFFLVHSRAIYFLGNKSKKILTFFLCFFSFISAKLLSIAYSMSSAYPYSTSTEQYCTVGVKCKSASGP